MTRVKSCLENPTGGCFRRFRTCSRCAGEGRLDSDDCEDLLEIDVSVTLETADEALDESYEASLRASSKTRAELYIPVDLNGFDGSFEILELRGTERPIPAARKSRIQASTSL